MTNRCRNVAVVVVDVAVVAVLFVVASVSFVFCASSCFNNQFSSAIQKEEIPSMVIYT